MTKKLATLQTTAAMNSVQSKFKSKHYYDRKLNSKHFREGEIKIASGRSIANPGSCDVRFKAMRETFWLRLHRANTWIY